nr:MarR family transcriptional regulator [Natrarchaeobaculum sulfurireducens]
MTLVDDRVLEYIREHESGSPKQMKEDGPIRYSRQYIARRCRKLAEEGLLTHLGNGVYVITEDGEAYLDEKLDTGTWQYVEENGGECDNTANSASNST